MMMNKCTRCGEVNPAEIHTCSPQTKAQRLADKLSDIPFIGFFAHGQLGTEDSGVCKEADAELRRLDALNAELMEALEEVRRDIQHLAKGHFVHLPTVVEELGKALVKAKEQTNG